MTQNKASGNQPSTMETLPQFTVSAKITTATATATTATAATASGGDRTYSRRPPPAAAPERPGGLRACDFGLGAHGGQLSSRGSARASIDPLSAVRGPQSLGKLPSSVPEEAPWFGRPGRLPAPIAVPGAQLRLRASPDAAERAGDPSWGGELGSLPRTEGPPRAEA